MRVVQDNTQIDLIVLKIDQERNLDKLKSYPSMIIKKTGAMA